MDLQAIPSRGDFPMKVQKNFIITITSFIFFQFIIGCAAINKVKDAIGLQTRIDVPYLMPAKKAQYIANTIEIENFSADRSDFLQQFLAKLRQKIQEEKFIKVVTSGAKATLEGELHIGRIQSDTYTDKYHSKKTGKTTYTYKYYKKLASSVTYKLNSRNGTIASNSITPKPFKDDWSSSESTGEAKSRAMPDEEIIANRIEILTDEIVKDISPHREYQKVKLMRDSHPSIKMGVTYAENKNYELALQAWRNVLDSPATKSLQETRAIASYNIGVIQEMRQEYTAARDYYTQSQKNLPDEELILEALMRVQRAEKNLQLVRAQFGPLDVVEAKEIVPLERRMALVIGNAGYSDQPLRNPINDANDITNSLRLLGFTVSKGIDLTLNEMEKKIHIFSSDIKDSDLVLFYYSGHGVQNKGENFLLPIDAKITGEIDEQNAVNVDYILTKIKNDQRATVLVLDTCRSDSVQITKGYNAKKIKGLSPITPSKGTFIMYATSPGAEAIEDRNDRNSIFTKHFLNVMQRKRVPLRDVFTLTTIEVKNETNDNQVPWSAISQLNLQKVYLNP